MAIDPVQNQLLKQIWDLDEKLQSGQTLTDEEKAFYNSNLSVIVNYYNDKSQYWNSRKPID